MSKILRKTAQIFASTSGLDQVANFGTFAQGSPTFSTDPAAIQTAQFLNGWFSAVLGNNSPTMEDMNAVLYVLAYQAAYCLQEGVPEWDSATTYYIGSFVQVSSVVYVSTVDTNLNNTPPNNSYWQIVGGKIMTALGDVIYGDVNGNTKRLAGNTTATRKFLAQTGTGSVSAAPVWTTPLAPTIQKFLSGSGTYTTPANVLYLRVRALGAGGGGGGTGSSGATSGSNGGNTTFGTSLVVANGGGGGGIGNASGSASNSSGGSYSLGGLSGIGFNGSDGAGGSNISTGSPGGAGGNGAFGGGAPGGPNANAGDSSPSNSGGGGGGAGGSASLCSAAGGAAGGFVDVIIPNPSATYSYGVGALGGGGTAGSGGSGGGSGSAGVLEITEFYQ